AAKFLLTDLSYYLGFDSVANASRSIYSRIAPQSAWLARALFLARTMVRPQSHGRTATCNAKLAERNRPSPEMNRSVGGIEKSAASEIAFNAPNSTPRACAPCATAAASI